MVNRLSASASEIFAGAMQDYNRAIIVGGQSFGKGTVQSITSLNHGQLKITESKFYRVSGNSTQNRGVVPDIPFPPQYDAKKVGESSLENAMHWDSISPVRHKQYHRLDNILPELLSAHQKRIANDPDFVFLQEQMAYFKKLGDVTHISLHEETRRKEREQREQEQLALENKRRTAKGEEPLTKLDEEEDETTIASATDDKEKDEEPDALLMEAARILLDATPAYTQNQDRIAQLK